MCLVLYTREKRKSYPRKSVDNFAFPIMQPLDKLEFVLHQRPNSTIPRTPEITTSRMEENSFFLKRFHTSGTAITTASTTSVRQSNAKLIFLTVSIPKNTVRAIVTATERMSPPRAGRILAMNVLTGGYLRRFLMNAATTRMTINYGNTTPTVARSAPRNPPCS